ERGTYWPIFVAPVLARWAVTPLVVFFRYARPEGLGRAFNGHARPVHGAAAGAPLLAPAVATSAVALGLGAWVGRRLGGLTGDVYGAAVELGEVAFLVGSIMVVS